MAQGPSDYIPRADAGFDAWQANYVARIATDPLAYDLKPADAAALLAAAGPWKASYPAHVTAQAAAQGARAQKDADREALTSLIRSQARRVQASSKVTDAGRALLGLTVRDTTPTPAPPPTSRPVVRIEAGGRLRHTVRFTDESTPTRSGKPAGTIGAEVWLKLVDGGEGGGGEPDGLRFLALTTRPRAESRFGAGDAGKTACYFVRWVSTRGEKGPWSETVRATVAA